jgi:hypothetical protein
MAHRDEPVELEVIHQFADAADVLLGGVTVGRGAPGEPEPQVVDRDAPEAAAQPGDDLRYRKLQVGLP